MGNILLASLGESPAVVSIMYDLLTKRKGITFDEIAVLVPSSDEINDKSLTMVEWAFEQSYTITSIPLPFEDANSFGNSMLFLQTLYRKLQKYQKQKTSVYLSFAGGRKSMSALMAWIVPLFPCIKGLYHVIDPDNDHFPSINDLTLMNDNEFKQAMHPADKDLARLKLVEIPLEQKLWINEKTLDALLMESPEDIETRLLQADEAVEAAFFLQNITNSHDKILNVWLTQSATKEFNKMSKEKAARAHRFKSCFKRMRSANHLRHLLHVRTDDDQKQFTGGILHFFKLGGTVERPTFYTRPKDIRSCFDNNQITDVVVCSLEIEQRGKYRPLKEIINSAQFSGEPCHRLEDLASVRGSNKGEETDDILIVPLGTHPMVVTQLYTLLTMQHKRNIQEIVLIYPQQATEIVAGVDLLTKAFREEKKYSNKEVKVTRVEVTGLRDIDSTESCQQYRKTLEQTIDSARHLDKNIILSLSGGRKGMAVLTLYAAQNRGIHTLYHTLVTDETVSEMIDEETSIEKLQNPALTRAERNNRLFLRTYNENGNYGDFTLFTIPVISNEMLENGYNE